MRALRNRLNFDVAPPLRHLSLDELLREVERDRVYIERGMFIPKLSGGAAAPAFAATPNNSGATASATLDTSLTAPTNTAVIFTAGASGSKVDEMRFLGLGTTVSGVINIFRKRGGVFFLIDQILVTAITSSTTAIAFSAIRTYENLILVSGDTIEFTVTIAGLQSLIKGNAFGGDF